LLELEPLLERDSFLILT